MRHRWTPGHLIDTLRGLAHRRPAEPPRTASNADFTAPPRPQASPAEQYAPGANPPTGANFLITPPGCLGESDLLTAYLAPPYSLLYHERQGDSPGALPMLNTLGMSLCHRPDLLPAAPSRFAQFMRQRHGPGVGAGEHSSQDLRDFHNHVLGLRPALGLCSATADAAGEFTFDPATFPAAHAPSLETAPAIGLRFAMRRRGDPAGRPWVVVRQTGRERFMLMDAADHLPRHIHAASPLQAVTRFIALLGEPGDPGPIEVLYPHDGPPGPPDLARR